MIRIDNASSVNHFEQILNLQRRYHVSRLSPEVQEREGFVFAEHSLPLLERMAAELPQAIALSDDVVVGYCLSLPMLLHAELPSLAPMLKQLEHCKYHDRPLTSFRFFEGGQVCVDRAYRGRGLLARLYDQVRLCAPTTYDLCITEISARNQVSLRVHERMGFETIRRYLDQNESWVIVAWNLAHPAVLRPPSD